MSSAVARVIVIAVVAAGTFGGTIAVAQDSRSHAAYVARAP
jgi:hypothetical protein